MKIEEFAIKNGFSNRDKSICIKLYNSQEKTEREWYNLLKDKISFDETKYLTPKTKKEEVLEKIKNKKNQLNKEK